MHRLREELREANRLRRVLRPLRRRAREHLPQFNLPYRRFRELLPNARDALTRVRRLLLDEMFQLQEARFLFHVFRLP